MKQDMRVLDRAELVEEANWQAEGGCEAAQRLLERVPAIAAIFAQNDFMCESL